jgi:hypothetical protein
MHRLALALVGLVACLSTALAAAQTGYELPGELGQPPAAAGLEPSWPDGAPPLTGEVVVTDTPAEVHAPVEPLHVNTLDQFLGYRCSSSSLGWIFGGDDGFGMFSLEWDHYRQSGVGHGLGVGLEFHFLSGPVRTDMPPRVYDFSVAYQARDRLGVFSYDVAVSVMASSDFEGSSREGIRFPSHAVGFVSLFPATELVFGVDYLDRGDYKLLPVAGLIVLPNPDVRLEIVFPRPRMVFRLTDEYRLYLSGELGGGTWAIERVGGADDLATYRDLRLRFGLECVDKEGQRTALEIGYLFDRRLEYSSGNGDYCPADTATFRLIQTF